MRLFRRGNIWWVTYGTHPQVRVSTKKTDKREAQEYALRYVMPSITEEAGELLERAARLKTKAKGERAGKVLLSDAFSKKEYVQRHGTKESSARAAGGYWDLFVRFCSGKGIHSVGDLTPAICRAFVSERSPRSAQCAVIYCRQILRDCGCNESLFPPVPKHRDVTHREPLTPSQIKRFLECVDEYSGARQEGMKCFQEVKEFPEYVRVLLYTGLRMGDAATLKKGMIDMEAMTIRKVMDKTSREVEFPIHPSILNIIKDRIGGDDGYLFPNIAATYLHERRSISHRFAVVMKNAGLSGRSGQYCAHCLRATFATLCAEHGVPIAVIQSWLGHTSPMVTRIYARIEDMKRKREALSRLPDFG